MRGALRVPDLDLAAAGVDSAAEFIRTRVFQSFEDSPGGYIVKIAKLVSPLAPGLVISKDAVTGFGQQPNQAEWARFVEACDFVRGSRAESA